MTKRSKPNTHRLTGKVKLFVMDLDGTALDEGQVPYARFSKQLCAFLDELDAAGCRWSMDTTWGVEVQWQLVMNSFLDSRPLFYMGGQGSQLARHDEGGPVMEESYSRQFQRKLLEEYVEPMTAMFRQLINAFTPGEVHHYGPDFWFGVSEANGAALNEFVDREWKDTGKFIVSRGESSVGVKPAFYDKGTILKAVMRLADLGPDEVVVAGDGVIDLPMMTPACSRHLLCPANAVEEVKSRVRAHDGVVSESPYSSGVIDAFKRLDGWNVS